MLLFVLEVAICVWRKWRWVEMEMKRERGR